MKHRAGLLLLAALLARQAFAPVSSDDRNRPAYHFLPPANWMNDTMGIHWKGEYHIFYLYNPDGPVWRQAKEWAHAYSTDLVRWKHLPSALGPLPNTPEDRCCQTGSLAIHDGLPTAAYTCAPGVCIATSADNMRTWRRDPQNPVIPGPPSGLPVTGFRDPYIWHEEDGWYLLQASGTRELGGTALLYKSRDLRAWEYLHPILPGLGKEDVVWEVPGLFRLGNKDILIYSPTPETRFTRYFLGAYRDHQFHAESRGKMDFGGYFYAATTFEDQEKRRIMIGWVQEGRSQQAVARAGWSGILSVPRVLSLGGDGQIRIEPVREIERLRTAHKRLTNILLTGESHGALSGLGGDALDIIADFDPGDADEFGLKVRASGDGREETLIYVDRKRSRFMMDLTRSSLDLDADRRLVGDAFDARQPGPLRLRILVDRSVVEAFADGRAAITGRVYPTLPTSVNIQPYVKGGTAKLRSLDVWRMQSIR